MAPVPEVHPAVVPAPRAGAEPVPPLQGRSAGARLRSFLLGLATVALTGAAAGAFPVVTGMALVVGTILLRGLARGAYVRAQAQAVRGRRWWDRPRLVLGAPIDVVATLPGTFGLLAWAGGLVAAEALVCYSLAVPMRWALTVGGLIAAVTVAIGPGSGGVRLPLRSMTRRLTNRWQPSLAMIAVLFAGMVALLLVADNRGFSTVPWPADWHLPFVRR